jgi:hypothetical protein
MRWFVDVSSVGKATEKERYCVDADSWQRALQATRALRNDPGPMTGFSIELLDDGFSAVDPIKRQRYSIRKAPADEALTGATPAKAPASQPPPEPPRPETSNETPSPSGSAAKTAASRSSRPPAPELKLSPKGSKGRGSTPAPARVAATPAPTPARVAPLPAATPSPTRAPTPGPAAPAPRPLLEVLAKREQDPDASKPLTYREYAYLVEGSPDNAESERLLREHLAGIQSALAGANAGKLVNLALFNVRFMDRPSAPPLATLTWKDWRGDAVVTFPDASAAYAPPASRRLSVEPPMPAAQETSAPAPSVPRAPVGAPVAPAPVVADVVVPAPAPLVAPPPVIAPSAPVVAAAPLPAAPPPPVAVPAPVPAEPAPTSAAAVDSAPVTDPPPTLPSTTSHAEPAAPPLAGFPPPAHAAPEAPPDSGGHTPPRVASTSNRPPPISTRTPATSARLRGEELITDLFESMHDLQFLRDSLEGADFCLTMALEKMPARGGIVHLYDIDHREYVITCAGGEGGETLLLTRYAESDPILSLAMRRRRSLVFADAQASAEVRSIERYATLGGAKSLVVAPVALGGRFLGAIELLNPVDDVPFTDDDGYALSYIAEQLAAFVGARGILLDRDQPAAAGHQAGSH